MNAKHLFLALSLFATLVASADITGLTDLTDDSENYKEKGSNHNIEGTTNAGDGAFNMKGEVTSTKITKDGTANRLARKVDSTNPLWVYYEFKTNTVVNAYRIWNQYGTATYFPVERAPKDFYLEGGIINEGSVTWTMLDSRSDQTGWESGEPRVFEFRNKTPYKLYRMTFTAGNGDKQNYVMIQELEYFCRPMSDDSLTVTGSPAEYGSPTPGYGERSAEKDGTIEASIATPIELDTGKLAGCVGWKTEKLGDDETWSPLGSGDGNATTFVHPGGDVRLTWNFEVSNQVAAVVHGSGMATGGGWFLQGESAMLKATAGEGYDFVRWIGDTDGVENPTEEEITVTADSPRTLTAFFVQKGMTSVLYVSPEGDDANDGFSQAKAKATVGAAVKFLDETFMEGTIFVASGVYEQKKEFFLSNPIEIVGLRGRPEDVVLRNTNDGSRVLTISNRNAVVTGVVIENGRANWDYGGNVKISGDGGTISNCVIRSGGGNQVRGANVVLSSPNALLTHCVISNGAVRVVNGEGNGTAVFFTGNGGRVSNCLITENSTAEEGARQTAASSPSISVVVVSNGTMDNCTIVDNCHSGLVSAVSMKNVDGAKVVNCVIAGNSLPDGTAVKAATGDGSSKFVNCVTDGETRLNGTCKVGTLDEMFENPTDGRWLPKAGGILDDAGTTSSLAVPSVDLRGNPRIHGDAIDVGCYEIAAFGFIIRIR